MVQWLGLCAFTAGGEGSIPGPGGSIPGQGTKILHAARCTAKNKQTKAERETKRSRYGERVQRKREK